MPLQDPEGILAQPRGGHIQRRTLQKQIAEDKELQEQMDKKEAEMREELQRKRDVSTLCPAMRAVMWLLMMRLPMLVWQYRPSSLPGAGGCCHCTPGIVVSEPTCHVPSHRF